MKRWTRVSTVTLLAAMATFAADPVALRSLFPNEADVSIDAPGLVRLDLPPDVVASCLSGLPDIRLFDADGNEVPFLLDAPRVADVFESESFLPKVLEVRRAETPREHGSPVRSETFELSGPPAAPRAGTWRLVFEVAQPQFAAGVVASWKRPDGEPLGGSRGTIFRLDTPRHVEKLELPLGPSAIDRIVVSIEHEEPRWLEPSFRVESSRTIDRTNRTTIPLAVLSTTSSGGTTVVELARPRGIVPEALRLGTRTRAFDRRVSVADAGPGHTADPLGGESLFRVDQERAVEDLELAVRPARGDRLRVSIEDGDSPPLAELTFAAVFGQPSLVASMSGHGVLRFGGGRARVPRYDLAGLRPEPGREVYGRRAEALVQLYDPAAIRAAHLGPIRRSPVFDQTPALAFAMRPGAAIDAHAYEQRRMIDVQPSTEGLARLRLAPEDLAALAPDLADLRIVDAEQRQRPYLVEHGDAAVDLPLVAASSSKNRTTVYRLTSPVSPLTADRLHIDVEAPFFDRAFTLNGAGDGKETTLARGRLARAAGDTAPVAIVFPAARLLSLELRIEDGDDAPLQLRSIVARCPVPDVFVTAPQGSYRLLLGSHDATPPSYELGRVRDVVLAVAAGEIHPSPLEKNPDYRLSARFAQGGGPAQVLLWVALIAAVVVLGALTLRLARQNPAG